MKRVAVSDVNQCSGCRMCEMICSLIHVGQFQPSKSFIKIHKIEEKGLDIPIIGLECDLCEWEEGPQCVRYCPTVVLKVEELPPGEEHVLDRIRAQSERRAAELAKAAAAKGGA
jgi:carbon-monoxide dehydrogenase iron sulfur subunit